ncbi:Rhs-family protein [Enhygromyxa salina]|uniref:Rhs-family protein n=1 Tax=Enhygromyxa salina TaxID=215803 RepID=A0A0C1ZQM4_9BACT|nr:Rhs-family protein [Enhygromyxa salina]
MSVIPGPGVNADTSFERFAFDGRSLLVGASDDDSQISWRHDSLGAALLETQTATGGPARAITYARDGLGNATATTYPGGRVIERSFDGLRRTRTISEGGAPLVQLDYLGPSVARRTYFQPDTTSEYTYDLARRMIASEHVALGGAVIDSRTYNFDEADNKQSEHSLGSAQVSGARSMTHDSLGRMVASEVAGSVATDRTVDYELDHAGNRVSVSGGTCAGSYALEAGLNQYTQTPCEAWTHDAAGNLSQTSASTNAGADRELEYDHRGRLVAVVTDAVAVRFGYDALGRKIRATSLSDGATNTAHYVYDDWNVIEEYDNDDASPSATYLYGNGLDHRLQMIRGESWWYYDDESGSTTALVHKPTVGSLWIERYAYQDFGEPSFFWAGAPVPDSYSGNPYLFAGRRWLAALGLYDLRTRHLDPISGRFISRDSLGSWADEENLGNGYTYVTNAPGSATDPTGEAKKPKIKNCHAGARANIEDWLDEAERQGRLSRDWFNGQAGRKRKRRKSDWNNYKNDGREWWGKYNDTRFHRIKWNFRKIVRRCSKNVITFKCRSTGEICGFTYSSAWTLSSWHSWIRVCKNNKRGMFRRNGDRKFDRATSGGKIAHEISHNINAIGDKKLNGHKARTDDEVRALASRKPTRASWNGFNYQQFAVSR